LPTPNPLGLDREEPHEGGKTRPITLDRLSIEKCHLSPNTRVIQTASASAPRAAGSVGR